MNNYSIYHIHDTNTPSLMEGYIGITMQRVSQRFSTHKSHARRGVLENKNLAEFLTNTSDATVTVLQENLTKAEAERLENLLRPIPKVGLNVVPGGCSSKAVSGSNHPKFGKTVSDETRAKLSATLSDGRMAGENHPKFGTTLSDAHKAKLSEENAGANNPSAKVANIYRNGTDEVVAENVIIQVWARENGYVQATLSATSRADRSKPSSATNRLQHKGIYARYVEVL